MVIDIPGVIEAVEDNQKQHNKYREQSTLVVNIELLPDATGTVGGFGGSGGGGRRCRGSRINCGCLY